MGERRFRQFIDYLYDTYGAIQDLKFKVNDDEGFFSKAKMLGLSTKVCNTPVVVVSNQNNFGDTTIEVVSHKPIHVTDCDTLFGYKEYRTLDLRNLDFSQIICANHMFEGAYIDNLILDDGQLLNCLTADAMFKGATINCDLNLNFLGAGLYSLSGIFTRTKLKSLKINKEQVESLRLAKFIFYMSNIGKVDMSECVLSHIEDLSHMCANATIGHLIMPKIQVNMREIQGIHTMFTKFKGDITLNGFDEDFIINSIAYKIIG